MHLEPPPILYRCLSAKSRHQRDFYSSTHPPKNEAVPQVLKQVVNPSCLNWNCNLFKTGTKPVLNRFGASSDIKLKKVTLKNILKTGFKRVAIFWLLLAKYLLLLSQPFWQRCCLLRIEPVLSSSCWTLKKQWLCNQKHSHGFSCKHFCFLNYYINRPNLLGLSSTENCEQENMNLTKMYRFPDTK